MGSFRSAYKLELFRRLGQDWRDLAVLCDISAARLTEGYEAYQIWDWLHQRDRLDELPAMLYTIGRRELADLVLRHTAPDRPWAGRRPRLPADTSPGQDLLGRAAPRRTLRGLVDAINEGRGGLVFVEGEAGIGKSSIVRVTAEDAIQAGCRLIWAACDRLDRAFPLQPLVDALRLERSPGQYAPDLVAARAGWILDMLTDVDPTVLIIDDLHWADIATLATLTRLVRTVQDRGRLLIVGVARPMPDQHDLEVLRQEAGWTVTLSPLAPPDVVEFVARSVGGSPSGNLLALAAGAGGNPLYLTELMGALARDGFLIKRDGKIDVRCGATPPSLSAAIANRLDFLRPDVRQVLEAAALLGDEFAGRDLATITGRQLLELWPHLREATQVGVLADRDGTFAFRHGLLRLALYDRMPRAFLADAHREAAHKLAKDAAPVDRVARQLLPVAEMSGRADGWTAQWLAQSGHQLVSEAPGAAITLLRWELAGRSVYDAPHDELACCLADALYRVGDTASAEDVAETALDQVTRADLIVSLHWTLAQCRAAGGRSHETLNQLRRALESPEIGAWQRARLLVLVARVQRSLGNIDEARLAAEEALEIANDASDRWTMAWAWGVLALSSGMRGEPIEALPLFDRALGLAADRAELADLRLMLLVNRAMALRDLGRYREAFAAVMHAQARAKDTGNRVRLAQAGSVLAEMWFDIGRWDAALCQVDGEPAASFDPTVRCCGYGIAAVIGLHRGDAAARWRLTEAESYAGRLGARLVGPLVLARSLDEEQNGTHETALAVLIAGISAAPTEITEVTSLLADTVRLAMAVGDRELATAVVAWARVLGSTEVPHRVVVSHHCRGLLDGDPTRLAHAARRYRRVGRLLPCAQALEAASKAAADSGNSGAARQYSSDALLVYRTLHADWDVARVTRTARRAA